METSCSPDTALAFGQTLRNLFLRRNPQTSSPPSVPNAPLHQLMCHLYGLSSPHPVSNVYVLLSYMILES